MKFRRVGIVISTVLLAAGCERPTAPEAREIAREVERKFERGDLSGIGNMFHGTSGLFAHQIRKNHVLEIARNGARETINGYVIEEMFVTPGGVGRPRIRRTLVGWPDDLSFALHATTDADAPYMALARASHPTELLARTGITLNFRDTSQSLRGQTGDVGISAPMVDAACGTTTQPPPINFGLPDVRCDFALYIVDVRGELLQRSDLRNGWAKGLHRRQHLRIADQRVPGVRFTVTCPEFNIPDNVGGASFEQHNAGCRDVMHFWLDDDLFAPALDVKIEQMQPTASSWYGPSYIKRVKRQASGGRWGTVRWTIHSPDGRLIESSGTGEQVSRSGPRDVDSLVMLAAGETDDRRIQALIPAQALYPDASRYAIVVLNLDLGGEP